MSKRSLPRGAAPRLQLCFIACAGAGVVLLGGASCVTPQDDYNSYISRAADAMGPPSSTGTVEAGPIDAANLHAPDSSFSDQKYLMACIAQFGPEASEALLWVSTVSFMPQAGGGGTLNFSFQPLNATATNISSPIGTPFSTKSPVNIAKDGTGTIMFGDTMLPKEANAISPMPVTISGAFMDIRVEGDKTTCGLLGGDITEPAGVGTLQPPNNPCIFLPTKMDGTWAPFQTSDFHCP